jgi:hypothetical protein
MKKSQAIYIFRKLFYNLDSKNMDIKNTIQEEKLQNILQPRKGSSDFKITLRFTKFYSGNFERALNLARQNEFFFEEGKGDTYRVYASFYPDKINDLHRIFDLVKNREDTKLFINNKVIPYAQDLWIFLAWFYRIK